MTIAALRFNNPGNVSLPISGYSGPGTIVGISGQSGYASFPDMATGYSALQARLQSYISNDGLNTISALNSVYAQDPAWGAGVSSLSGIALNAPLNPNDSAQMSALSAGIVQQETGMTPSALGVGGDNNIGTGETVTMLPGSGSGIGVLPSTGTITDAEGNVRDAATGDIVSSAGSPYGSVDTSAFSGSGLESGSGPYDAAGSLDAPLDESGGASTAEAATPATASPSSSTTPSSGSGGGADTGAGGKPVFITDASNTGQVAGNTIGSALTGSASALDTTATGLVGSIEKAATDLAIRFGLILVALILIAGAYVFFAEGNGKGGGNVKIVPVPA